MDPRRLEMKKLAMNNLRGLGLVLKKLPITLLRQCDRPNPRETLVPTCNRLEEKGWIQEILGWGRDGLTGVYLEELVRGEPYVKNANIFVALKASRVNQQRRTDVVGFLVYGSYVPKRNSPDNDWFIHIPQISQRLDTTAEIEAVIRKPGDQYRGIGAALLEFAIADMASRRKAGAPRYTDLMLFTSTQDATDMRDAAARYGFLRRANMQYRDEDGNNITQELVDAGEADPTNTTSAMHLDLTINARLNAALNHIRGRVVNANVCPKGRNAERPMWTLCR